MLKDRKKKRKKENKKEKRKKNIQTYVHATKKPQKQL